MIDRDILTFLLFIISLFGLITVNQKYWHFQGWRTWLGIIICSLGLSAILNSIIYLDFWVLINAIIYIGIGSAIWLIKPKRIKTERGKGVRGKGQRSIN